MTYSIINIRNKDVVGTRKTRRAAQKVADKLDLAYGAISHRVTPIYNTVEAADLNPGDIVRINRASHWEVIATRNTSECSKITRDFVVCKNLHNGYISKMTFSNLFEMA